MDLVPLKVKIGLRANGHADHPDFNVLGSTILKGMDWSHYIDKYGMGWHYDKSCGHKEHRAEANAETDSPMGMQWGVLMVPKDFADAAVAQFSSVCFKLTEAELTDWYDNRCHAHESDEKVDKPVLEVIKAKQDAGIILTAKEEAALDVNDPTPGITKNRNKNYVDFKSDRKLRVVQ